MYLFVSQAQATENSVINAVTSLVQLFDAKDKSAIAKKVIYPLARKNPIPPIVSETELIERFDEVFDGYLVEFIVQSDPKKDWSSMGWRGIMLENGLVWLDTDGNILAVNYQSKAEQKNNDRLIKQQQMQLHPSVAEFKKPLLDWETQQRHIRIDELENGQFRYVEWPVGHSTKDSPTRILHNGKLTFDGSGGNHSYLFSNGIYQYTCYVWVLGTDDTSPGSVTVSKNGENVLHEPVINVVNH